MAEPKTARTGTSVSAFLNRIADTQKRRDCKAIDRMMRAATGNEPAMWGTSIVGYGTYEQVYASGRTGSWPIVGLSPRAQNITLYIMPGFSAYDALLNKLGKHKTGKACLYIKRLTDIDAAVLRQLIGASVREMRTRDRPDGN